VEDNKKGKRKKILLVLDNAKYHHAKLVQPWLEEMKDSLELCLLPAYSPELNAIERLWKKTRRKVTHTRFFISLENLAYDLKMYWNTLSYQNQELKIVSVNI
jgi:transposase